MSTTLLEEVSVYCGTYAKYNSGDISGRWLCLGDYDDYDEFIEACKELHDDEEDPEFMFQDYEAEGVFRNLISECSVSSDIWEAAELLSDGDNDISVYKAFAEAYGETDVKKIVQEADDRYVGEYNSDEDFAEDYAEQIGVEIQNAWPHNCIDWKRAARDLMFDFTEHDGHYFSDR